MRPFSRARAVLIRPARPAAASRWPRFVFTAPSTHGDAFAFHAAIYRVQRFDLYRIAEGGAGSVGFHEADLVGLDPRVLQRSTNHGLLRESIGSREHGRSAIVIHRRSANHCANAIAILQRVREPLENDDSGTFSGAKTVRGSVECLCICRYLDNIAPLRNADYLVRQDSSDWFRRQLPHCIRAREGFVPPYESQPPKRSIQCRQRCLDPSDRAERKFVPAPRCVLSQRRVAVIEDRSR